ncbi:MAG TPA: hypothetical protein VFG20_03580, partial [Planctomycetaceae bacterium]|nr:hypothetical protein [Planctomycetaceae bacterium]
MRGILIGLGMLLTVPAMAAPPAVKKPAPSATKKAAGGAVVDVVALRAGRTLRGAILQHRADRSVTMAVSRSWLKTANPELFEEYDAANLTAQREAWGQARDRLKEFLATPPESQRLTFFLQSELQQLEDRLAAEDPKRADFIWVELPGAQVAKVTPATPEHQRLAVIAWNEGFVEIETQDAASLQRELTKRKIKFDGPTPDISSRLPARPQDDQEWSARLAVIEYVHRQPLDFQGMGDMLVPVGGGQKPDLAIIFHKLMHQQMNSLMRDLLNDRPRLEPVKPDRESFAPAIATAEAQGVRGFRVTRLEMEPDRNRVGVETRFVAK